METVDRRRREVASGMQEARELAYGIHLVTPWEDADRAVEVIAANLARALRKAWAAGWGAGWCDREEGSLDPTPNPYREDGDAEKCQFCLQIECVCPERTLGEGRR